MPNGIGSHQSSRWKTDDWITPPHIIRVLGPFDLDPCASVTQPWPTATRQYTILDGGLLQPWQGRVWLNPPYGRDTSAWMSRLAAHGDGIALIFARVETQMFFHAVWNAADAVLFLKGRLTFYYPDGSKAYANSGGPSALVAYGARNVHVLSTCDLEGKFIPLTCHTNLQPT